MSAEFEISQGLILLPTEVVTAILKSVEGSENEEWINSLFAVNGVEAVDPFNW